MPKLSQQGCCKIGTVLGRWISFDIRNLVHLDQGKNNFFVLFNLKSNDSRKGDSMSDDEAHRTVDHICNCVNGLENAVINYEHSTGAQRQQWNDEVQRCRDNILNEVLLLTKSGGNRGS